MAGISPCRFSHASRRACVRRVLKARDRELPEHFTRGPATLAHGQGGSGRVHRPKWIGRFHCGGDALGFRVIPSVQSGWVRTCYADADGVVTLFAAERGDGIEWDRLRISVNEYDCRAHAPLALNAPGLTAVARAENRPHFSGRPAVLLVDEANRMQR